ncbi:MAG: hypothetical protein ACREUR_08165 [Nitrosospira sp.]
MKPQLPALVMPLSTVSETAQADRSLQGRTTLSDGGCGPDRTSATSSAVHADGTFHGPAGSIPSYAHNTAGLKRHNRHVPPNVRTGKKRFG